MNTLLLTFVGLFLGAIATVATLYYMGPTISGGSASAIASAYQNQYQQIKGAKTMAQVKGVPGLNGVETLNNLVADGYLEKLPDAPGADNISEWSVRASDVTTAGKVVLYVDGNAGISEEACLAVQQLADKSTTEIPVLANSPASSPLDLELMEYFTNGFGCIQHSVDSTYKPFIAI